MSIEDQIRSKQASAERTIRYQHDFEERLREFLSLASALTDKELEIALARLADLVGAESTKASSNRIKGLILNLYYQLRVAGLKKRSTLARTRRWITPAIYTGPYGEYLISKVSSFQLPSNPNENAQSFGSEDDFRARIKLLAP